MNAFSFTEKKDTRSGFGAGLLEAGRKNPNVVALCADLTGSLKMDAFVKEFPDRFVQTGIAESNMIGVAAGLCLGGKIPFAGTFAAFAVGRTYDQIRQAVAYSKKNVKIVGSHSGITVGEDGATHQMLEDMGMMKALPGMCVIHPCDFNQAKLATMAVAEYEGPVYLRVGRPEVPNFTDPNMKFEIGKGIVLNEGKDVTLVVTGHLTWPAVEACQQLEAKGISVELINIHTIKPLDTELILKSALKTRCVVTAEEHQVATGLGDSVANFLSRTVPTPVEMLGMNDVFGETGTPQGLMDKFHLNTAGVIETVEKALQRKN